MLEAGTKYWTLNVLKNALICIRVCVVLEKDGEDQLDRPYEKRRSITEDQQTSYIQQNHGRLSGLVTYWCRNCLLKYVIEGKIEGKIRKKTQAARGLL
jgi:hypothetical protein